jgi:DNA-binding GntR family transcriptional regulator
VSGLSGSTWSAVAQDRRFHELLARGADNRYLETVLLNIYNLHLRLWYFLFKRQGGLRETVHEHQQLIEALIRRNPDAAELAMRNYVARVSRQVKNLI